jgi:hypothetical protein
MFKNALYIDKTDKMYQQYCFYFITIGKCYPISKMYEGFTLLHKAYLFYVNFHKIWKNKVILNMEESSLMFHLIIAVNI